MTTITNPTWLDANHTSISYEIDGGTYHVGLPTLAEPQKTITDEIIKGTYGTIAEYTLPPVTEEQARQKRNQLLTELDAIVSNPLRWNSFTTEQQSEYASYRQALLDVPQQGGFPTVINWPTKP